jgi:hypothetical protein
MFEYLLSDRQEIINSIPILINVTVIICNMAECACPEGGTGLPTSYAPVCFVFGTRVFVAGVELFLEQK